MPRKGRIIIAISLLILAALACNLPSQTAPPPDLPTPDLTMTALFSMLSPVPGTATQAPVIATTQPVVVIATTAVPPTSTVVVATQVPPTNTNVPSTVTSTPALRTSGKFNAAYMSKAPVLDGVWDEWTQDAYPMKFVVYGAGNRTGKEDLEGSFRIGWDNNNLYLAVKVLDDEYVQNATGQDIYKGDSIELLLDLDLSGDLSSAQLNSDDYQLGISPGKPDVKGTKEAYLWFPSNVAGGRSQVQIASVSSTSDGVYRIEAAIPWSVFGVSPSAGRQFGFAVSVSDNDNTSKNEQQSMVSCISTRTLTNPTTWALLTLTR